ncbi:replication initiation protein [Selenomonas sp. oral taxon 136]|jgi:plasmid replication initiation protein|uniref:replication initiation protein n=1 Tax=Selenomonas sp. oral taxon 136 TaxID=713030 RepID=UPI0007681CFF|nr:replication initiation protein [Selenomonas sp. oral taxon 136]AME04816.1 hypothetical protein AXE86_11755 [Selenomonas sp. oral taxon 136]
MNEVSILEKEVVQANPLIEARKHMNLSEMRLFLLGLQGIKPNISTDGNIHDVEFHDIWVSPSQLERLFSGKTASITNLKRHIKSAYNGFIELAFDGGGFGLRHIYAKMDYFPQKGLLIKFDDEMKPYILDILNQSYTRYALKHVFPLSSEYGWRIMELLLEYQGYLKKGKPFIYRKFTLSEIRFLLNVPEGLYEGRLDNFRVRVLDTPIREINEKTIYHVWYDAYKEGRKIAGFTFYMERKHDDDGAAVPPEEVAALDDVPTTDKRDILARLMNPDRWNITEKAALKLVQKYPLEYLDANIRYAYKYRDGKKNLGGWLMSCIERDEAGKERERQEVKKAEQEHEKEKARRRAEVRERVLNAVFDDDTEDAPPMSEEEPRGLAPLSDIEVRLLRRGGASSPHVMRRMEQLGLTLEDVKAGKRG